jgi:hypothetical protein
MHKVFSSVCQLEHEVQSLLVNGLVSFDQPVIKDHVVQFYETLFFRTVQLVA